MKLFKTSPSKIATLLASVAFLGLASQNASAVGTAVGTNITNTAVLTYAVGATVQPFINSSAPTTLLPNGNSTPGAGAGTPTVFTVDNRVDFTVLASVAASVVPGQQGILTTPVANAAGAGTVLTYLITNNGNAAQGFNFTPTNVANATAPDTFDPTQFSTYVVLNPGITAATTFNPAAGNAVLANSITTLAPGQSVTVFVLANIPNSITGAANALPLTAADLALVTLTVSATQGNGFLAAGGNVGGVLTAVGTAPAVALPATGIPTLTTQITSTTPTVLAATLQQAALTAGANATQGANVTVIDTVFAESANFAGLGAAGANNITGVTATTVATVGGVATPVTAANNGVVAVNNQYTVVAAALSVAKSSSVICDPIVGGATATVFPSNIPGAIVQYAVTVTNASTASSPASLAAVPVTNPNPFSDPLNAATAFQSGAMVATTATPATCVLGAAGTAGVMTSFTAAGVGAVATAPALLPAGAVLATIPPITGGGTLNVDLVGALPTILPVPAGFTGPRTAGQLFPGESVTVYFNVGIL
jgi:hypothetical protein